MNLKTPSSPLLAQLTSVGCVWADIDFKDFPGESFVEKEEAARKRLSEFPLAPTMLLPTGGGLHAYWVLNARVDKDALPLVEKINKGIAKQVGGDATHDITRLLRVPETTNFPNKKKAASGRIKNPVPAAKLCGPKYDFADLEKFQEEIEEYNHTGGSDLPEDISKEPASLQKLLNISPWFSERWNGNTFTESKDGTGNIDRSGNDYALALFLKDNGISQEEIAQYLYHFPHGKGQEAGLPYIQRTVAKIWARDTKDPPVCSDDSQPNEFKFSKLGDLLSTPPKPVDYLVDRLLLQSGLSVLAAKPKVGKTTLAEQLALCVGTGEDFLGRSSKQGLVLYFTLENGEELFLEHMREMGAKKDVPIEVCEVRVANEISALDSAIKAKAPRLVVIDTIAHFTTVDDFNDYAEISRKLAPLDSLAKKHKTHIMIIHHAKKERGASDMDSVLGSTAITGTVGSILILDKDKEENRLIQTIQRRGENIPKSVLKFDEQKKQYSILGTQQVARREVMQKSILDFLSANPGATEKAIKEGVTGRNEDKGRALRALLSNGEVERAKSQVGRAWTYSVRQLPPFLSKVKAG